MKHEKHNILRHVAIGLILFCSSTGFSQNSEIYVKDVNSTVSTSKSGLDTHPKVILKDEFIGTRPITPSLEAPEMIPYVPSNENTDKKASDNSKNTSKPN